MSDQTASAGQPAPDEVLIAADLEAELRLCLTSGIGPRIRQALMVRFGSARAVFEAAPSDVSQVEGVGPKLSRAISAARRPVSALL